MCVSLWMGPQRFMTNVDRRTEISRPSTEYSAICVRISNIAGFGLGVSINLDQGNEGAIGDLLDILVEAGLRTQVEILSRSDAAHHF
jgi:uncharacterized protein YidB (DUF937 family)